MVLAKESLVDVILGVQFGDEGKGKLVDLMVNEGKYDMCVRCQGGSNAGHTIVVGGTAFDFHLMPSGILNENCICLIGHGVVIHLPTLVAELEKLDAAGISWRSRFFVSDRAQIVFDFHQLVDGLKEMELGAGKIGTTKRGIGPAYSSKASRNGIRMHHLFDWQEFQKRYEYMLAREQKRFGHFEYDSEMELERFRSDYVERFRSLTVDGISFLHGKLASGSRVLVEGANAMMLDLDCGTYPFVTSSNTGIGGVMTGLGIPPMSVGATIGVMKAYATRVGAGPFPTEDTGAIGEYLVDKGHEYGTTTGRKRRCGWLDLVICKYSCQINGYSSLNLTKLDVLTGLDEIKIAVGYKLNTGSETKILPYFPADLNVLSQVEVIYEVMEGWKEDISKCQHFQELPKSAQRYITRVESFLQIPVKFIGTGPDRIHLIKRSEVDILASAKDVTKLPDFKVSQYSPYLL